jgi:hypothetical protein
MLLKTVAMRMIYVFSAFFILDFHLFDEEFWDRVIAAGSPGVTTGDAPAGHNAAFEQAVHVQGVDGI